ncbi:SUN domain-containing protein 2 [Melia azedarach]|uniref:SUN domain-containing protein 2 n=1 Tax=Melia azedarach TaxID=155640 RepID=A0ACC1Y9W3_MELAZ|nr:SUN domain-containing protein 2 [Melia azedarach]
MNPKSSLAVIVFFVLTLVFDVSATSLVRKLARLKFSEISAPPLAEPPNVSPAPAPSDGLFDENKCFSRCTDRRSFTACLQFSHAAIEEAFLFVKNDGQSPLNINVTISHPKSTLSDIQIPKQGSKKINISASIGERLSIILNAGYGNCTILVGQSVPNYNILKQLSFYASHGTPVYGVYLVILTVLITGVTWACCKSKKSEWQGNGVPYQDLEMAKPESLAADNVETVEAWDQGWGNKWDEIAEKSESADKPENGSANGLTSSSFDRDGWENDWND